MPNQNSSADYNSTDFEKVALERFRSLATCIPNQSKIFRETWDCSTVLSLDFQDCPSLLESTIQHKQLLISAVEQLGLGKSIIFRLGKKVVGWTAIASIY